MSLCRSFLHRIHLNSPRRAPRTRSSWHTRQFDVVGGFLARNIHHDAARAHEATVDEALHILRERLRDEPHVSESVGAQPPQASESPDAGAGSKLRFRSRETVFHEPEDIASIEASIDRMSHLEAIDQRALNVLRSSLETDEEVVGALDGTAVPERNVGSSEPKIRALGHGDTIIRTLSRRNSMLPIVGEGRLEQYSTYPCVLQRSPLVELGVLNHTSDLFFDWQNWANHLRFRWFKPTKSAWLRYYDQVQAKKAYSHIYSMEPPSSPKSTIKHSFQSPSKGAAKRWTIHMANLEPRMTKSTILLMFPENFRPNYLEFGPPSHLMEDKEVLRYIQGKLDDWNKGEPSCSYTIYQTRLVYNSRRVISDKNPAREAIATFTEVRQQKFFHRSQTTIHRKISDKNPAREASEPEESEYAHRAMQYFLNTPESLNKMDPLRLNAPKTSTTEYSTIPSIHVCRRQAIRYSIPIRFAKLISQELLEFRGLCKGCTLKTNEFTTRNGFQKLAILINSHSTMNLARAKSALARLLEGSLIHIELIAETVGKPLYHSWFASFAGKAFVRKVEEQCKVFVHVDIDYRRITIHGPRRNEKEAHMLIYDHMLVLMRETGLELIPGIMRRILDIKRTEKIIKNVVARPVREKRGGGMPSGQLVGDTDAISEQEKGSLYSEVNDPAQTESSDNSIGNSGASIRVDAQGRLAYI